MSWLSDAVSGRKSAEKSSAKRRKREAAAKKKAAAQKAARERAARAAAQKKAAADAARAQQQAQARAQQAAQQRAAEQAEKQRIAAEQARIAEEKRLAQELSDKRVSDFNKNLAAAKQAGTKEMQLLRVEGLKSEDSRVRELAGGITENKATSLDAPSRQVSEQKASVKQKIKRRSSSSGGRGTTLGSLGGGQPGSPFSLG